MNRPLTAVALLALLTGPALSQSPADAPQPGSAQPAAPATGAAAPLHLRESPLPPRRPEGLAQRSGAGSSPKAEFVRFDKLAGPYLAARMAVYQSDFTEAADYYLRAVQGDPSDAMMKDSALVALMSAGRMEQAEQMVATMPVQDGATDLGALVRRVALARQGDWDGVLRLTGSPDQPADGSLLLDGMFQAWAEMGAGRASDAMAQFARLARIPGARAMADYHLALVRALVGDYEGAEKLLSNPTVGAHLMGTIARVQILSQLDRNDQALKLLEGLPGLDGEPSLLALRDRLKAREKLPFTAIRDPKQGIAQVLVTFSSALAADEDPDPLALIHARLAAWLAPDLPEAHLVAAQLLQGYGQFDLAEQEYAALRQLGEVRPIAELARAEALIRAERFDAAEAALRGLNASHPDLVGAWVALGDLMRQREKYADAVTAYDKALALMPDDREDRWFPLYARGIARERQGDFPGAEADMRAALKLRPDQPQILNYLGYSWIDRNQNLDEALRFIKAAVKARPDDGYILDSLAWAYFRLGRYAEAVAPMERAVTLMAADSLVNDHMGDIYWMAGRKREAEVQWKRALSLGPEKPEDAARIRAKLDRGLDAVLAEEKANGGKLPPQPLLSPDLTAPEAGEASGD